MREHLDDTDAARLRQRDMSAQELLEADEHLSHCASCRRRLAAAVGWNGAVFGALPEGGPPLLAVSPRPHLTYEQLAGYVDDQVAPPVRELVGQHVADCRGCRTELEELTQFAKDHAEQVPAKEAESRLGSLELPPSVEAYLRRAIVNRIRDNVHRLGKAKGEAIGRRGDDAQRETSRYLNMYAHYTTALERLELRDRALIVARFEARLSYEDIADKLDYRNANIVRVACTRALRRLLDAVERESRRTLVSELVGPLEAVMPTLLIFDDVEALTGRASDETDDSDSTGMDTHPPSNSSTDLPERDSD